MANNRDCQLFQFQHDKMCLLSKLVSSISASWLNKLGRVCLPSLLPPSPHFLALISPQNRLARFSVRVTSASPTKKKFSLLLLLLRRLCTQSSVHNGANLVIGPFLPRSLLPSWLFPHHYCSTQLHSSEAKAHRVIKTTENDE